MRSKQAVIRADDGKELAYYEWAPEGTERVGVFHIAHGMAEHAARYERLAERLTAAGWLVYANDHRGHGRTAQGPDELGHFADRKGWERVTKDLALFIDRETQAQPLLPFVLFGHSMGSFMAQQMAYERGDRLSGLVLSASNGRPPPIAQAGRLVARVERLRLGARGKSPLLRKLSFEDFNKAFAPNRTAADWLSRDPAEVDKYVADPWCGFECSTTLWVDLLDALPTLTEPRNLEKIPKNLRILVMAGCEDPVSARTRDLDPLLVAYKNQGLQATRKYYPEARHEILNETNRAEVMNDLVRWLDETVLGKKKMG